MSQLSSVVRFIHKIKSSEETVQLTDASLLARFVANRDEAAFGALVKRHSAMVMAVCRRILTDHHRAEDAMQACFFVLARKAASIKRRRALASWLYGVATRIALKARTVRNTLQQHSQLDEAPAPDCIQDLLWNDLRPVLDQEIERLPEKYRAPFVLCYLQSKTNAAAALELQCPEGTIVTRLARARARLRQRLSQRGVTLSIGCLAATIDQYAVPTALLTDSIRAVTGVALEFGVGRVIIGQVTNAKSVLLAKGVLKTMVLTKMKTAAILILGLVAIAGGTASYQKLIASQGEEKAARQSVPQSVAVKTREGSHPKPAEFPPPPSNDASQPPSPPGGFVVGVDQRNTKAAEPLAITTFYTPVFEGGAVGQPVPFTLVVQGLPLAEAGKVMNQIRMPFQMNDPEKLSDSEKLDRILARLAYVEHTLNAQAQNRAERNPPR